MLEKPEINLSDHKGDVNYILNVCVQALYAKGKELNEVNAYQHAINSMKKRISDSHSFEGSLYILSDYCKLIRP